MNNAVVIIPTYNEKENIVSMVNTVLAMPENFDLLVVDDNSPDGTAEMVKQLQITFNGRLHILQRKGKEGLGRAYIAGFKWALENNYNYIFEMDADFSHNPADLSKLYHSCLNEATDLAIGSRYVSGVNVINWPISRVLMSYFASIYVKMITGMKIHDATAGFKCFRRRVLETLDLDKIQFKGYAFQIEMKFATWKLGFNIKEIPIVFTDRKAGSSKMTGGIFNEALFGVIIMKYRSLFRSYRKKNE